MGCDGKTHARFTAVNLVVRLNMLKLLFSVSLFYFVFASEVLADPSTAPKSGTVTKADFFLYSCVHEYMTINKIKAFDGSVSYAVEFSSLSSDELNRLYDLAQRYAASIRKPDYNDTEHGLPAVLVLCQLESKKV